MIDKLLYGIGVLLCMVGVVAGAGMVLYSMGDNETYWLIFGLGVFAFAAHQWRILARWYDNQQLQQQHYDYYQAQQ